MIEQLLTSGSIPEPAMRRCVLWETHFTRISHNSQAFYPLWWPNCSLRWCAWTYSASLVQTNKRSIYASKLGSKLHNKIIVSQWLNFFNKKSITNFIKGPVYSWLTSVHQGILCVFQQHLTRVTPKERCTEVLLETNTVEWQIILTAFYKILDFCSSAFKCVA